LSATSEAIILCAGVWLSNLNNWKGDDYELTEDEIDIIDYFVAELESDVMTAIGENVSAFEKIAEEIITEDAENVEITGFEDGEFQAYELWISGLQTDYTGNYVDHIDIQINEDERTSVYFSLSIFENSASYVRYEHIANVAGLRLYWAASSSQTSDASVGHVKIRFYAPQSDDYKTIEWSGTANDMTAGKMIKTKGTGNWGNEDAIESIKISPVLGTTFKVDPGEHTRPSELKMTLYGLG